MLLIKIYVVLFIIVIGIPVQIIDYKHRKRKAYEPGDAWAYYARLARQGNRDGKFMMLSTFLAIGIILFIVAHVAHILFTA